jgi:hypothetical protein
MRRIVFRNLFDCASISREVLPGRQWDRLYAALANGGHLDSAERTVSPAALRDLRASLPPLSLFGAALYSYMLPGKMRVGWAWPVCRETIAAGLVQGISEDAAEALVGETSTCRHVDREQQEPEQSGVTPMPVTIETLSTGAVLESEIWLSSSCSPIEAGCAAWAIGQISHVGGKSGAGLGHVRVQIQDGPDPAVYEAWIATAGPTTARDALFSLAAALG